MDNPFDLYDGPGRIKATKAIKHAIVDMLCQYNGEVEPAYDGVYPVMERFASDGATDTMTRDAVQRYMNMLSQTMSLL